MRPVLIDIHSSNIFEFVFNSGDAHAYTQLNTTRKGLAFGTLFGNPFYIRFNYFQ